MPNRIIAIQYLHVEMTRELTGELTNAWGARGRLESRQEGKFKSPSAPHPVYTSVAASSYSKW